MSIRKRLLKGFAFLATIAAVYCSVSIWISSNMLTVDSYDFLTDKIASDVKLAVLSDLHNHEFGRDNQKLVEKVDAQEPDLILLVGDMLNENTADSRVPCELIRELLKVAPVYYALGNHELNYMQSHPKLCQELKAAGAQVLDKEYVDLNVDETRIRLGGLYDYAFGLTGNNDAEAAPEDIKAFLEEFQSTDSLKIMLSHRPDSFIFGDASDWKVDLVISGHNHGGQVILPFVGGVWGGDQGWFPEYVAGIKKKGNMYVAATRGLGSHKEVFPRFNNPPEIMMITLKSAIFGAS